MFVLSLALRNIFHTPMAQYSLFVLKVLLNTNQPNHQDHGLLWLVTFPAIEHYCCFTRSNTLYCLLTGNE